MAPLAQSITKNNRLVTFSQNSKPTRPINHGKVVAAQPHRNTSEAQLTLPQHISSALLATATAISLAIAPMPAHAVSGGGGMGSSLSFKDLSGQDLRKSNFTKADLRGANFSGCNLEGIRMFGAIVTDAKFVGANMRNTDLELAVLDGADLSNAVLEGAMLQNAQLQRIKSIEGADFTDVLIRKDVQSGLCKIAKGTNPTTGVSTRESLYCPP